VLHNTILIQGTYANAIEYRYAGSAGTLVANNLVDGQIRARDGATGSVAGNYTSATASMFVDPASGDLHLRSTATAAIDRAVTTGTVDKDFDGQSRSGSKDIGADEFGGGSPTVPAPGAPTNLRIIR
jgi:hypothetical protein